MEKSSQPSKPLKLLNLGLFPIAMIISLLASSKLLTHCWMGCDCQYGAYIRRYALSDTSTESKLLLLAGVYLHLALIVFLNTQVAMYSRVITRTTPLMSYEPTIINVSNRIISNTIEQGFVFGGLFGYYLLTNVTDDNKSQALNLAVLFVIARLVYYVGYLIQGLTGILVVRSSGFAMTLVTHTMIASICFGHNLIPLFTQYIKL